MIFIEQYVRVAINDIFLLHFLTGLVDDEEEDPPEIEVPVINGWTSSLLDISAAIALLEEGNIYIQHHQRILLIFGANIT